MGWRLVAAGGMDKITHVSCAYYSKHHNNCADQKNFVYLLKKRNEILGGNENE